MLVLVLAALSGRRLLSLTQAPQRFPVATVVSLIVVGVPTVLQLAVAPELLDELQRNRDAIFDGEVWRIVTALVVQDGLLAGAVFNLVILAIIGLLAEPLWGRGRWVLIASTSALLAEGWGLVVQPIGGGNSVAVVGLAAAVAVLGARSGDRVPADSGRLTAGSAPLHPRAANVTRLLGLVALAAGVVLFALRDIHGGAAMVGGVLGLLLAPGRLSRPGQR